LNRVPWLGRARGIRWFYWRGMEAAVRLREFRGWLRGVRRRFLGPPQPGSSAYRRQISEEIGHYSAVHAGVTAAATELCEQAPPVWEEIQTRCVERIRRATGMDVVGNVATRLRTRPGARLISLGSGPGGVELAIAREAPEAEVLCLDLNFEVLELGRRQALLEKLMVRFQQADLNTAELPEDSFDVALCYASLHHLVALERVMRQISRCLRPGGELVVLDIITRNGFRMWPDTRRFAKAIWATLPERYRVNHTAYASPKLDSRLWRADTRRIGMECVRSEDILPLLRRYFDETVFVPLLSLATRFCNTMYGPNYDLNRPLDRAIADWIWELDVHLLDTGRLRPESFFGVYAPR